MSIYRYIYAHDKRVATGLGSYSATVTLVVVWRRRRGLRTRGSKGLRARVPVEPQPVLNLCLKSAVRCIH